MKKQNDDDQLVFEYEKQLHKNDMAKAKKQGSWFTPSPIVDYIVRAVDDILKKEFNKENGIADENVKIIDPASGTGAFELGIIRKLEGTFGVSDESRQRIKENLEKRLSCSDIDPIALEICKENIAKKLNRWCNDMNIKQRNLLEGENYE